MVLERLSQRGVPYDYLSVHQVINNAQEIIVPKVKGFWHRFKVRLVKNVTRTRWEEDYELIENEGLFQEYLEMGMCLKHVGPFH